MEQNQLVSVVIPTYGRPSTLISAVRSVLMQSYKNLEIIIVDDNSDDYTIELVQKEISDNINDVRVKYFSDKKNRGGASARNKGIELSSGEYITFLDDDDVYLENKILHQVDFLIKNNLDVCVCDMFFMDKNRLKNVSNCIARVNSLKDFILDGNCYTPMILCKRKILIAVGGFTETPRYQDHILMIKILEHSSAVARLPEKLFIHNNHDGDRISYSNRSIQAYNIREEYEFRNIHLLNDSETKEFKFKKTIFRLKIARMQNDFIFLIKQLILSLKYISSAKQCWVLFKTVVKIVFFGKGNI